MINLVISKSNSNESLSQIKAEAMLLLMANNDKKAWLQHLFKVENGKQKEKAMAPLQFYKDIIPNAIKKQNKFLYTYAKLVLPKNKS